MTEQEIIKSAENFKQWCEDHYSSNSKCKCLFADRVYCRCCKTPKCWTLEKPKPRMSEFEYEYLKRLDKKYKYIARDNDGRLFAYKSETRKSRAAWKCKYLDFVGIPLTDFLNFVTWDDKEPTSIQELIKEYEDR